MTTLITKTISKVVMIVCLVYSIYLLLNGGNYPGGGFIGGVLLVCGISIVYLAYGAEEISRLIKPQWFNWVGFGLLFASLTAIFPLFVRHHYFRSSFADFEINLFGLHIGTLEFVSSMMFDLGVYFTVVGALLFIITQIAAHKVATAGKEKEEIHAECIDGSCRVRRTEYRFQDYEPELIKSAKQNITNESKNDSKNNESKNDSKNNESKNDSKNNESKNDSKNNESKNDSKNNESKNDSKNDSMNDSKMNESKIKEDRS